MGRPKAATRAIRQCSPMQYHSNMKLGMEGRNRSFASGLRACRGMRMPERYHAFEDPTLLSNSNAQSAGLHAACMLSTSTFASYPFPAQTTVGQDTLVDVHELVSGIVTRRRADAALWAKQGAVRAGNVVAAPRVPGT